MPLQISGAISLADIQTEFGGSNPISISEYYRGGSYTTNNNGNVPTSGQIALNHFYGGVKQFVFAPTIAADTLNYNIKSQAIAAGWNQVTPLYANITINSGVYVGSSSTGAYAMDTGVTFPTGSSINITNNGFIMGMGGSGSSGGNSGSPGGYNGAAGGPALLAQVAVRITNNGTIGGGGGGGGGGRGGRWSGGPYYGGGGGGGGRGLNGGAGGGGGGTAGYGVDGNAGAAGTKLANGAGGYGPIGDGGAGGALGSSGAAGNAKDTGAAANYGPYGGYAGGACTSGNANITWVVAGTRSGALN